jgi:hypothetical protein
MNITKKKIMNLLNMKNTMKMNGKMMIMNAPVNVKTKMNMKRDIAVNSKFKMRMNMNVTMKPNMMAQM